MTRQVITNNARGGRMILTPEGGTTLFPGESRVLDLTDNELKHAQPYFDNGDFSVRAATEEDDALVAGQITTLNPTPSSDGAKMVEANTLPNQDAPVVSGDKTTEQSLNDSIGGVDDDADVTNVKHLGFGRWFGMKGDEKVTEAMNRAEAEAFAAEHKVPIGEAPDPSEESTAEDETQPEEPATPPDETSTTEEQ